MSARTLLIAFFSTLVVLAGTSVFLLLTVNRWQRVEERVAHTFQVMNGLNAVVNTTVAAESGQRAFQITEQQDFLKPYEMARQRLNKGLGTLDSLVDDNPQQQQRADRLRKQIIDELVWLDSLVISQRDRTSDDARYMTMTGHGFTLMDRIQSTAGDMLQAEDSLLARRSEDADRQARTVVVLFAISTLLAAGLVLGLYRIVRRDQETREIASRALKMNNERLEARVAERTAEIASANDALVRSNHELRRSNRELQEFAYVASHDLQEPLRKIRTFADLLREEYSGQIDEQGQHYLTRMQQSAGRMSRLISDLLTFSRVATKARAFEPMVLDEVLREVLEDLDVAIREAGAQVTVEPMPRLEGDAPQMRQLFQNLIGNALKFRRPGEPPVVTVRAVPGPDEAHVTLQVQDNGIGFDEKYRDRIFVPFQRLHTRGEYDGTGIGLAVVRRIVERHGGSVAATSRENVGTTFSVTLPRHHDDPLVPGPDDLEEERA